MECGVKFLFQVAQHFFRKIISEEREQKLVGKLWWSGNLSTHITLHVNFSQD